MRHAGAAGALAAALLFAPACARREAPAEPGDFHLTIGVAADSTGRPRIESSVLMRGAWTALSRTTLGPEQAPGEAPGALLVERLAAPGSPRGGRASGGWVCDFSLYENPAWRTRRARGFEPSGVEAAWSEHYTVVYDCWRGGRPTFAPPSVRKRFAVDRRNVATLVTLIEDGRPASTWDVTGLVSPSDRRARPR